MIIRDINIDGFGIFNDFRLRSLKNGVNILFGDNEAGKSTLLKFIRFTLFGYPRSLNERMEPLKGGRHGGRIKTVLSTGKEVVAERTGKNSFLFRYDGQEIKNESQWFQLISNATGNLFNNVYAFTVDELSGYKSLEDSKVEDKIYSVGLGLGETSIGDIEKEFQQQADNIYKGRGSTQIIPGIIRKIDEKKSVIKAIQDNLPKYQELTQQISDLEKEVDKISNELNGQRAEKNRLDNYLKCYSSYVTAQNAEKELNELPDLKDYPEKGVEKLEKLEEREQQYIDAINQITNGTSDEKGIDDLENEIAGIDFNSRMLAQSGQVEYLRANFEKYKTAIEDKAEDEKKISGYDREIRQGIEKINSRWSENDIRGFGDLFVHKNEIDKFRKSFEKLREEKAGVEGEIKSLRVRSNPVNVKNIAVFVSVVFLLGSFPAFYYGLHVLGGVAVAIALLLFFGKKYFAKETLSAPAEEQLKNIENNIRQIQNEYESYLEQELKLPKSLTPETAVEALKTVEELKKTIVDRDNLKEKLDNERLPFIEQFEKVTAELTSLLQDDGNDGSIELRVKQIIDEYNNSRNRYERKTNLQKELERKRKALANAETELKATENKIKALLSSISASDRNDFRKKYADNEKVKQLTNRKEEAVNVIETIVGYGKSGVVAEYLSANEKEVIEDGLREKGNAIDELEKELTIKNNNLGEKRNERKRIEGESELAGAMTDLETEIQKLNNAYREWLSNKTALKILAQVKARYEQEKQPAVIKNTSRYFGEITRGKYRKVQAALDEKKLVVYDEREAVKRIDQLSRGTKEQLLISLRLGLIEEYEKQSEPLPIVVDEVLVNFDKKRALKTAEILHGFAENRQILIFTCHPETEKYFDGMEVNTVRLRG